MSNCLHRQLPLSCDGFAILILTFQVYQPCSIYCRCVSPVLSISAGAAGMLVALLVAAPCCTCGGTIQTMVPMYDSQIDCTCIVCMLFYCIFIVCVMHTMKLVYLVFSWLAWQASFVASSAFVLGAATFITSFYAFDHNLKDDSFLKDINCLLCYVFSRSTFRQISKSAANTTTRLRLLIIRWLPGNPLILFESSLHRVSDAADHVTECEYSVAHPIHVWIIPVAR